MTYWENQLLPKLPRLPPSTTRRKTVREYWIEGPWKGKLAIVPRPRGGDWLEDEISDWREAGINTVVSFLTRDEVADFELEAEKKLCEDHGIRFVSFPIPDRGVPASTAAAANLVDDLKQSLVEGNKVALHYRQSVGRSALIAACLLIMSGVEPHKAFERIGTARGCAVPDTSEQERWAKLQFGYSPAAPGPESMKKPRPGNLPLLPLAL
jgi:protein-tyrosine phosphatase